MTIAEIKPQKQHMNLITFTDGSEILLDRSVCIEAALYEGTDIDEEKLCDLRFKSEYERTRSRALWYLDRMDYSEKNLYEKLVMKGFDKRVCAGVLAGLVERGVVDDRRYAERLAEHLLEGKSSKREAIAKMLNRGIPYNLAKEVLDGFDVDEEERLLELIESRYAQKLDAEDGYRKVYTALVRKGFSYDSVRTALNKYFEDLEICEE